MILKKYGEKSNFLHLKKIQFENEIMTSWENLKMR